jgi:hypothetical protein
LISLNLSTLIDLRIPLMLVPVLYISLSQYLIMDHKEILCVILLDIIS